MTSRTLVVSLTAVASFVVLFANDNLLSSRQSNLIAQANAEIGRPLTPGSVAGVARRTERRAYRRGAIAGAGAYYGAGSYHGAGPYYGTARRAYYASGSNSPGYDAYASAAYGDDDTYILHGAYISGDEAVRYCAETFRSYDAGSQTFMAYSGQRVSCPQQ